MTRFRHNCNTGDNCWLERRWDPNDLGRAAEAQDGAWPFPRGISPTDIDGFIESNGRMLFIETKSQGAPIPVGQRRALESLSREATVLVQECAPPSEDAVVRTRLCMGGKWRPWVEMDRLQRDRLVQQWFRWADDAKAAA